MGIEQYNAWKKNVHKRTNITYSDFNFFYQFSCVYVNDDIRIKIEKLKPKWKRIINKLENKQL